MIRTTEMGGVPAVLLGDPGAASATVVVGGLGEVYYALFRFLPRGGLVVGVGLKGLDREAAADGYALPAYSRQLARVCDQLAGRRVCLAGISSGALVVIDHVARSGTEFARIDLFDPVVFMDNPSRWPGRSLAKAFGTPEYANFLAGVYGLRPNGPPDWRFDATDLLADVVDLRDDVTTVFVGRRDLDHTPADWPTLFALDGANPRAAGIERRTVRVAYGGHNLLVCAERELSPHLGFGPRVPFSEVDLYAVKIQALKPYFPIALNHAGVEHGLPIFAKLLAPRVMSADGMVVSARSLFFLGDENFLRSIRPIGFYTTEQKHVFTAKIWWAFHVYGFARSAVARAPAAAVVEMGVYMGYTAQMLAAMLAAESPGTELHLFDIFADDREVLTDKVLPHMSQTEAFVRGAMEGCPTVRLHVGDVRDAEGLPDLEEISFAHVDLNHAEAELAAVRYLWPRLIDGGCLLLDDFGHPRFRESALRLRPFFEAAGRPVIELPTGQAIVLK